MDRRPRFERGHEKFSNSFTYFEDGIVILGANSYPMAPMLGESNRNGDKDERQEK